MDKDYMHCAYYGSDILRLWAEARMRWTDIELGEIPAKFEDLQNDIKWQLQISEQSPPTKQQRWQDAWRAPSMQLRSLFGHLMSDAAMDLNGFPHGDVRM